MRRAAALMLAALVAACAGARGPDYVPPAPVAGADAPLLGATADAAASGAAVAGLDFVAAPVPDAWWRLYRSPALDRLVADAGAANTDLRAAAANLAQTRALLAEARVGRTVATQTTGGVTFGRSRLGGAGPADEQTLIDLGLDASYEVDAFGRVARLIEAARADVGAAAAARDEVAVLVAAETVRAFSDLCSAGERILIVRRTVDLQEDTLRLTRRRLELGRGTRLDVERAAAEVETSRAQLPPLEAERTSALARLSTLTGRVPFAGGEAVRGCVTTPLLAGALPVGDGVGLLRRRPDVRQAERELAASTARIGVATAGLYPTITLGGGVGVLGDGPGNVVDGDAFNFALGPLISWSFPNRGVARARVEQAEAETAAALARFDGTVLFALEEAQVALARLARERARAAALARAREAAGEAARLSRLRFRAGADDFLTLLDAERTLAEAAFAAAESAAEVARAQVDLFEALGGGWEGLAPAQVAARAD